MPCGLVACAVAVPLASHVIFDADLGPVTCWDDAAPKFHSRESGLFGTEPLRPIEALQPCALCSTGGEPIVTATDGAANPILWAVSAGAGDRR